MLTLFSLFVRWLDYVGWFRGCLFCVLVLGFGLIGGVGVCWLVCDFVVLPLTAFVTVVDFAVGWFLLGWCYSGFF